MNAKDFDSVICAEFMMQEPHLQADVSTHDCRNKYPKIFTQATTLRKEKSPRYKRRSPKQGGFTLQKRIKGQGLVTLDNGWVIPYNPTLVKKYQTHVHIEACSTTMTLKFLKQLQKHQSKTRQQPIHKNVWDLTKFA